MSVCAALETDELAELEALAHPVVYSPKATLFLQDEPADHLFNVTSGSVRLYRLLPDGRRQIVGFALPGDFLGLGLEDRHACAADAIDEAHACRFSRRSFTDLVERKPHLLRRLHEFTTHELGIAQDQMVLLGRQTAEERVASFLLQMHDRWSRIHGASANVSLPMSRQDIADYLGLTIETVSRTLTSLARSGLIVIVPEGVRLVKQQDLEHLTAA